MFLLQASFQHCCKPSELGCWCPPTWLLLLSFPHICRMLHLLLHPILALSMQQKCGCKNNFTPYFDLVAQPLVSAEVLGWKSRHEIRHVGKAARLRQDLGNSQNQITASVEGAMPHFLQLFLRHREQHFCLQLKVPSGLPHFSVICY